MKTYKDLVGDGGSDVVAQVERLQGAIAHRLSQVRHIVAIASGKGGVGKSTVVAQLAMTLARDGLRVAVLDADVNGPSQVRLCGVGAAPLVPGTDGLHVPRNKMGVGVLSFASVFGENESVEFQTVAQGESFTWRATREFMTLAQFLASVEWGELDMLLVDLPPGAERTFQFAEFLGPNTAFVLVTVPSDLARGVVNRSLVALNKVPNSVLGYVENMAGYYCSDCNAIKPLFGASNQVELALPRLAEIPFDPELAACCDRGEAAYQVSSIIDERFSGLATGIVNRLKMRKQSEGMDEVLMC